MVPFYFIFKKSRKLALATIAILGEPHQDKRT